jgi:predicted TIM-barrel fold metal-dependent hydrolase
MRIVDPHMHLWDLSRLYYGWLQDDPLPNNPAGDVTPIAYRSYGLADYFADATGFEVAGLVHVECGQPPEHQVAETDWLQALAADGGYPQGIVAGANLDHPDAERVLAAQAERPNVRGVRQIVNWHADPLKTYTDRNLLADTAWRAGYALLGKYGLSFDLQIYPAQMAEAAWLAGEHPEIPVILNHTGMPTDRDPEGLALWRRGLAQLAERAHVSVKISGLGMVDRDWTVESIRPFVLHAVDCFGVDRCMFASNFPVDSIHGAFAAHYGAYDEITRGFTAEERAKLFAVNAQRIYRLP